MPRCVHPDHNALTRGDFHKEVARIMATLEELQSKIDELTAAEAAREARDVAQDAVTAQQIAVLQQMIADLQAQSGLTPAQQAAIDSSVTKVQAVIDSLNAADPTPPTV